MFKKFFEPHTPVSSNNYNDLNYLKTDCEHNFIESNGFWVCTKCGECEDRQISVGQDALTYYKDKTSYEVTPVTGSLIAKKDVINNTYFRKLGKIQYREVKEHTPWRHKRYNLLKQFSLEECHKRTVLSEIYRLERKYTITNTFYLTAALLYCLKITSFNEIVEFTAKLGYNLKFSHIKRTLLKYDLQPPTYTLEELTLQIIHKLGIPEGYFKQIFYWAKRIKKIQTKYGISFKTATLAAISVLYPQYLSHELKNKVKWAFIGIKSQVIDEIKKKEGI